MNMEKVCLVGAGQMGAGIAQVVATAGFQVTMIDLNEDVLKRATETISQSLARWSKRAK